jgi:hypothetical protein
LHGIAYGGATAFFISPTKLLAASHSALKAGQIVRAQLPGAERVELNNEAIYKLVASTVPLICEMKVFKTFYLGRHARWTDIAILETVGINSQRWVELDLEIRRKPGDKVDVIGYPACHDKDRMLILHSELKDNIEEAISDANTLLPPGQLSVSYGEIIKDGANPTYRLSTTAGMSGGAVVLNGKVIGRSPVAISDRRRTHWLEYQRGESLHTIETI